jgi:HD-GYP domain-containing protein (c-di-GMP phosphodiesterase class II)
MTTVSPSTKPAPSGPALKTKHYRIATGELAIGMFVAELDRPWIDTPFLLQGFLIDSQSELDTVRKFCRHVKVDLELSNPEVADAIKKAELSDIASNEPTVERRASRRVETSTRMRVEKGVDRQTKQRFREFIRAVDNPSGKVQAAWWQRVLDLLTGKGKARAKTAAARRSKAAHHGLDAELVRDLKQSLPAGVKLVRHTERVSVAEELPKARRAVEASEKVLESMVSDIRSGQVLQVAPVKEAVDEMVTSMINNPDALMWVARLRDEDINVYTHGVKVSLYMIALGRQIGLPKAQLSELGLVGMLADVGKIKLPRSLLDKPGMLTPSEHSLVKEHVRLGLESLQAEVGLAEPVADGIAQHHERLDGTGYPKGLKGNEIGLYGKIAGIADSFAALITSRAYANAQAPQDALMSLYQWSGITFPEPLIEQFVQAIGVFPVGTLVELSSGEIAVVTAQNRVRRLEPKVLVLTWPDKRPLPQPIERDLMMSKSKGADSRPVRIARGLPAGAFGLKMRDFYIDAVADANGLAR